MFGVRELQTTLGRLREGVRKGGDFWSRTGQDHDAASCIEPKIIKMKQAKKTSKVAGEVDENESVARSERFLLVVQMAAGDVS
jgi:hypothetical protein